MHTTQLQSCALGGVRCTQTPRGTGVSASGLLSCRNTESGSMGNGPCEGRKDLVTNIYSLGEKVSHGVSRSSKSLEYLVAGYSFLKNWYFLVTMLSSLFSVKSSTHLHNNLDFFCKFKTD